MNYSLSRVGSLIKRDWTYHRKALLKPFAVFIGLNVLMVVIYYFERNNSAPSFWSNWHYQLLYGYGLLSTYFAFPEFKDPQSKQQYLSVPATTLEKYSVRWLFSMIAMPLVITGVFIVFNFIAGGEMSSLFRSGAFIAFVVVNALFFLIASSYNNPAVGLSMFFLFLVALIFVAAILIRIIFHPYFDGMSLSSNNIAMDIAFHDSTKQTILNFVKVFLGMGMPIAFWVISYYKLKEQEA